MSVTPAITIGRFASGPTVTIEVGADKCQFLLHKGLLISQCSIFFNGAFNSQFEESRTGVLSLPEEDVAAFELFVDWLYLGRIPAIPVKNAWKSMLIDEMKAAGLLETEFSYHKLYYMADKWCIPNLKDKAMDCIRRFHSSTNTMVHPHLAENGYANTLEGSTLRKYVMRSAAYAIGPDRNEKEYFLSFIDQPTSNVAVLLVDVMSELAEEDFMIDHPETWCDCDYHEPVVGNKCCG